MEVIQKSGLCQASHEGRSLVLADCLHLVDSGGTGALGNKQPWAWICLFLWKPFNSPSRQQTQTLTDLKVTIFNPRLWPTLWQVHDNEGSKVFPGLYVLQKGEVYYGLLQGRIVNRKRDGHFLDYLLSSRLRPVMCCSKDLMPKLLLFLLLRAPSSLTGVDASCLSFQSCGEPRLLLSDLYCKWKAWTENALKDKTKKSRFNKLLDIKIITLKASINKEYE